MDWRRDKKTISSQPSVEEIIQTTVPLRGGIVDDPRRMVPLISGGSVTLQTKQVQPVDAAALAGVPDQLRTEEWTGVTFSAPASAR